MATMLAEKLTEKQAPAQQGAPVLAEQAGTVQWAVVDGARVTDWQTLGEVTSSYGARMIACGASGIVAQLVQDGQQVKAGQVLGHIKPLQASQKPASTRATNHTGPSGKTPQPATEPAREPSAAPLVQDERTEPTMGFVQEEPARVVDQQPARRSTMPPALELIEIEPEPAPQPRKREKRPVIVRKTCRPTNKQEQAILKLMDELAKDGFDFSEGELHRVMFDWLLNLSRRELVALAEANRDKEQAGRYGWGARPQG